MSFTTPRAVAAVDRRAFQPTPAGELSGSVSDPAEAAGRIGHHEGVPMGRPVSGIAPYRGWTLWAMQLGVHYHDRGHIFSATKDGRFNYLHLTHSFSMTQARWEWLVDHDFPSFVPTAGLFAGAQGPWSEELLDAAIGCGVDELRGVVA